MSWYNLTAVNASTALTLTQSVRNLYFEPLGDMILLVVFFTSFISFNHFNNNPKINMVFSSLAVSILSIMASILGLVSTFTPYFCWGLFGVSIMVLAFTRQ